MLHAPPPVLIEVARCESNFNQFAPDGSVLKDHVYGTHYGFFQIGKEHIKAATAHGDDIFSPEGNISYALKLYADQGTTPWNASYDCWSKKFYRDGTPKGGGDA